MLIAEKLAQEVRLLQKKFKAFRQERELKTMYK